MASEEAKVINEEREGKEVLTAFNKIPYALLSREAVGAVKDFQTELTQICKFYKIYKKGAKFTTEGSSGD